MYKNGTQNDTPKARKMEIAKDGKWLIRLPGENSKKEEVAVEWRGTSKSEVDLTLMLVRVLDKDKTPANCSVWVWESKMVKRNIPLFFL